MLKILNKKDITLWVVSVIVVAVSFLASKNFQPLLLITSLLGVTSLIFIAKGHYIGNAIIVVFSLLYGYISYKTAYYGEMITYVCMTLPMAVVSLVSWLKNPYAEGESEVTVAKLEGKDFIMILLATTAVTIAFYFILKHFNTNSLGVSTLSIATSFFAASLTYKRSEFYALAYGLNDIVLIILWLIATINDSSYITMVICFVMFLINDIYGYISWKKMKARQEK